MRSILDIFDWTIDEETLAEFRQQYSEQKKEARKAAKPGRCFICGVENQAFCSSHTIPQYSLKNIADKGMLWTTDHFFTGNISPEKDDVGVGNALVFKMICRKCDGIHFQDYENPNAMANGITNHMMAEIALKCALNRIYQARFDQASVVEYWKDIRKTDKDEDIETFYRAWRETQKRNGSNYHLIHSEILPYTVPIAFQQQIAVVADFDGNLINNIYCSQSQYRIEPLYICIFPNKDYSTVFLFREQSAKRYRSFEKHFRSLSVDDQHKTILKLIFAYSTDVLISKKINDDIFSDVGLNNLIRISIERPLLLENKHPSKRDIRRAINDELIHSLAIAPLPEPLDLLANEYAI